VATPDATDDDPDLRPARAPLAAALALGAELADADDPRGAHEVYDCCARLLMAVLPTGHSLRAAVAEAVEASEFEPDPASRAETLRHALAGPDADAPPDPDAPADPLDAAHGTISRAIAVGAPAFNHGNVRGCCEVYAATARLLAGGPGTPDAARRRLDRGLAAADSTADEPKKAWVLRNAFDDVLALAAGRPAPRVGKRDVRVLISMAVQIGAPAYNLGDHRGCYEVYATTARLLLQVAADADAERQILRAALQHAAVVPDATEQAWVLRRAFDAILTGDEAA
jgi:hypothetical protein